MERGSIRYAVYGQACLYLGLIICVIIRPEGLSANGGISYYGIYKSTLAPFLLALLGSAYFSFRLAGSLNGDHIKPLKYTVLAMSLLSIGIAVTPGSLGRLVNDAHDGVGIVLFVLQLLISMWLLLKLGFKRILIVLVALEFLSGLAGFFYLAPPKGLLLQSEVVFQVCFGTILIYSLREIERIKSSGTS